MAALPLFTADRLVAQTPVGTSLKPEICPPSSWVAPLAFGRLSPSAKIDSGEAARWLLRDEQVNGQTNEFFFHFSSQILNYSGVQHGSRIVVEFDPSYEALVFHWVKIYRGTNQLDRLDREKIKVIQQENGLSEDLLDGQNTAVLLLEDVRVGDIIDYAYSRRGKAPATGGKFVASFPLQMHDSAERLSTRLLWPAQRRVFQKNHGGNEFKPTILRQGNVIELKWDYRGVAGLQSEDSLPVWYDPLPWVQMSEFQTWAEVNQWALGLYTDTTPICEELSKAIAEWRRIPGKEAQVMAVLRFVQNEVRYMGIEIGEGGHRPTNPSVVFTRRFGDCKDKSMLLVTILRGLGIEAWPVLVNTQARHTLDQYQPSMAVFDHAIAMVWMDKQVYWLDATASYQRGSLAARYLPNYERGLVIRPGTTGLTIIPPSSSVPQTTVTEYFDVKGKQEPAILRVVTVAEGRDADNLRRRFARIPLADIEKGYLNYYADLYAGIVQTQPVAFSDDEEENRFEITELYTINDFWTFDSAENSYRCRFSPDSMGGVLSKPAVSLRSMPLGLGFPQHHISRVEITLPRAWPVKPLSKTIEAPAFFFHAERTSLARKITLEYEYRSLSDTVSTAALQDYFQQLDEASQEYRGLVINW